MKKIVVLLIACCCYALGNAQTKSFKPSHELFVGYGISPLKSCYPDSKFTHSGYSADFINSDKDYSPYFSVGYLYHISDRWAVGATFGMRTLSQTLSLHASAVPYHAKLKSNQWNLMLTTRYTWKRWNTAAIYSRVGIGVARMNKADIDYYDETVKEELQTFGIGGLKKGRVAWQINPIGAEWSFVKHLAAFAEVGAGADGIGVAGLKVWF